MADMGGYEIVEALHEPRCGRDIALRCPRPVQGRNEDVPNARESSRIAPLNVHPPQ